MLTPEQQSTLHTIAIAAVESEAKTGCPAELSVAQCILESNWLKNMPPGSNNCFGIKDTDRFPGACYSMTQECEGGTWVNKGQAFEKYPTLADCFTDHAILITGGASGKNVYAKAFDAYKRTHDIDQFARDVAAKYATDPAYATKIIKLMHGPNVQAQVVKARTDYYSQSNKPIRF